MQELFGAELWQGSFEVLVSALKFLEFLLNRSPLGIRGGAVMWSKENRTR
jgi:hypothetical protein